MSARATFTGMPQLIAELTAAPDEIRAEGLEIVHAHTEAAATELRSAYERARRTGTMVARVRTVYPDSQLLVGQVQSRAPHAQLWHFGTKDRHTKRGAFRGRMPKADPEPLVPIAQRRRVTMYQALRELLRQKGFQVRG